MKRELDSTPSFNVWAGKRKDTMFEAMKWMAIR